jgi:hypothetical protein
MMYKARFGCCVAALVLGVAGCSIHPLPETFAMNFSRASTLDIVQKVRCEAQAGLDRFRNSRHPEHVQQIVQATTIGYDFKFVMEEDDDATAGVVHFVGLPSNTKSKRQLDVDLNGSATKLRTNTRTFRIIENLADVAKADCSAGAVRANLAYPIAGALNVDDVVYTYIRLELISNLGEETNTDINVVDDGSKKRTGVFSEHLTFRTHLELDAKPTLKLTLVAGSFRLTNATVTGAVTRKDDHDVIIAFGQDPKFHNQEIKDLTRAKLRVANLPPKKPINGPRAETELAAVSAVGRNKVLLELSRVRNLVDDQQENPKFLGRRLLTFLRPPDETGSGD